MKLRLVLRPEALQDLADGRDWYEVQRTGLGRQFVMAVETVLEFVVDHPESHPAEYRNVRRARVQRFPYVVYYRVLNDVLEVLAVLHGSRHPRVWRSRTS